MEKSDPIYAIQHIRKMRGGAQAHLLRASDNHFYVTKFQNNAQDVRILANEYLATKHGQALGLPMPEVRIIGVSEWLTQRRSLVRDLITSFRNSTRNPFPNWTAEREQSSLIQNQHQMKEE